MKTKMMTDLENADRFARNNIRKKRKVDRRAQRRAKQSVQDMNTRMADAEQIIQGERHPGSF